ncbi:hypothetical protein M0P48_04260 [Candidatus Gracilibacteria bacterium]|jgi:hypothetical protein|nr:hypothetical protein [Candidatus Gracilibacteria bacterium]
MPEVTPTPASAPASNMSLSNIGGEIQGARNKIDEQTAKIGGKIKETNDKVHGILRFGEVGSPTRNGLAKDIIYSAGDLADATIGTAGRRMWEVTETTGAMVGAILKMVTNPFLHPLKTLRHPLKYFANYGRILTTSIENYANIINAIPRSIEEVYSRGIARPTERLLGRIPKVGPSVTKLANGIGWVLKQPRHLTEWATKGAYSADDWMKAQQS